VKKTNIKPFNLSERKPKEQEKFVYDLNNKDEEHYFQIQIMISAGKERTIRIHRNDDPYEIAANLAKTYSMKEEVKDRLAQTFLHFMSTYLRKNNKRKTTRRVTIKMNMTASGLQQSGITESDINFDKI